MSTLATPSAKAHERVTGRWMRDLDAASGRELIVYYTKLAVGSPVPWLLWAYVCLALLSRAGLEIAAWSCATLTFGYIFVDRFALTKEFKFFRVGSDFFLLGYAVTSLISAANAPTLAEGLETLGGARWVILLYAVSYTWELFPGLNRSYFLMITSAVAAASYGMWQHFMGLDLLRGTELASAPIDNHILFLPSSFFNDPEILGTLIAMVAPFPAAAYLLSDRRAFEPSRWIGLGLFLFFALSVFWTYRIGLWVALTAAALVTIIMYARHSISFILATTLFFAGVIFTTYSDPVTFIDNVQVAESTRAEKQRSQINMQVKLWQESPQNLWFGAGHKALAAASYDRSTGNVYFQILAQSGILGAGFYLLFILGFMLATYRIFLEIPRSHYWHRVLIAGGLGSQVGFHISGLYWFTLAEAFTMYLFVLILASISYLTEHYSCGLVPDDHSL